MAAMAISVIEPAHGNDRCGLCPVVTIGLDLSGIDELPEGLDRHNHLHDRDALHVYLSNPPVEVRDELRVGIGQIAAVLGKREKLSVVVLCHGERGDSLRHSVYPSKLTVARAEAWLAALRESRS